MLIKKGKTFMQNDNTFLGTEKIGSLMFKLALPSVAAQLVNMLYNLVDRIYIGHIPNEGAMAITGIGVCTPIIMLISAFAALVSMGGAPYASISMGKGDKENAEKIMGGCFGMLIGISVLLTIVFYVFCKPLLLAFGASENTISYAVDYMNIYVLGTIFVQVALGMNAFITAQGFAKISMITVLIGAALNIVLDPLFIFGFHMGVRGAALATVLSQAISAVWAVWFLCGNKTVLRLKKAYFLPKWSVVAPCLLLGLSPFVMSATESALFVCFNSSLLAYGGDIAVGAMTILSSVMQFMMLPLQGMTQGAQPIVSYNFGAKNAKRVQKAFFLLLKIAVGYTFLLWAIVMLFPAAFARMFTNNAELISYAAWAIRIYLGVSCIFGVQIACQQTLVAIGNAKISLFLAVLRKLILLIPMIYILPAIFVQNKAMAVYLAEPVSDFIAVTVTASVFAVQFKKALRKIG